MKLYTLILAATFSLVISTVSFGQTSFINLKSIENNKETVTPLTTGSIKFNVLGIANGIVKVKMINQPDGIYKVQLSDASGNLIAVKQISHTGITIETVDFGKKFAGGSYEVSVINPDNKKTNETIMLLL